MKGLIKYLAIVIGVAYIIIMFSFIAASWTTLFDFHKDKRESKKELENTSLIMETLNETRKGYTYVKPQNRPYLGETEDE
jgi:hypothetical protein